MKFMEAVNSVFSKYGVFSGRARRSELWYFVLFNFIVSLILGILGSLVFNGTNWFTGIWGLIVLIPSLAVDVRRLHDIGKAGPWILIGLIPIVGTIIMLVWCVRDSQPNDNKYGPCPK